MNWRFIISVVEQPPTQADFDDLRKELDTDPEFGLVGQMNEIKLMTAPEGIVDYYRKLFSKGQRRGD